MPMTIATDSATHNGVSTRGKTKRISVSSVFWKTKITASTKSTPAATKRALGIHRRPAGPPSCSLATSPGYRLSRAGSQGGGAPMR